MVGGLYTPRTSGATTRFSIFYMGINLGGFISPIVVGFLAQSVQFRGFLQPRHRSREQLALGVRAPRRWG